MGCQVHIFFNVLMILITCRCATQITLLYLFYGGLDSKESDFVQVMFYLNLSIELFLNVVILYYRIKTKVNSDDVRKTKMMEDEQVPETDEIDYKGL